MASELGGERYVFIGHSGRDTWVAKQIAREVAARGATPFLDEAEVDVGADFEEEILGFLGKAHELLVLLAPWLLSASTSGLRLVRPWAGGFQ